MKKKILFVILMCIISVFLVVPVDGNGPVHSGWGVFPLIDPEDDVYNHTEWLRPTLGEIGDFADEIDVLLISLNTSVNISITFAAIPSLHINKSGYMYIDNNSDGYAEYRLYISTEISLRRYGSNDYWNWSSSSWVGTITYLQYNITGNAIEIKDVATAIPEIALVKLMFRMYWRNHSQNHTDLVLNPSSGGAPPIDPLLVILGISIIAITTGAVIGTIGILVKKRK